MKEKPGMDYSLEVLHIEDRLKQIFGNFLISQLCENKMIPDVWATAVEFF